MYWGIVWQMAHILGVTDWPWSIKLDGLIPGWIHNITAALGAVKSRGWAWLKKVLLGMWSRWSLSSPFPFLCAYVCLPPPQHKYSASQQHGNNASKIDFVLKPSIQVSKSKNFPLSLVSIDCCWGENLAYWCGSHKEGHLCLTEPSRPDNTPAS